MSSGERISKDKENDDEDFDYVFILMNPHSKNVNKRNREESVEPSSIPSNPEASKLIKVGDDLEKELACSICLKILHKCATLNPCQHNFCSSCLLHSLKSSVKCPNCRIEATSVVKNTALRNVVGLTLKNFPGKERPKEEIEQKNIELKGTIVQKKSWTYIGIYKHEKREGKGTLIFPNGKICKGKWENDVMQKVAEMITKERVYEGDTDNFQMHGKGVLKWSDGDIYEGSFVRDVQEGFGILKCSNGIFYEGQWKKGKKHGEGVGGFKNGDRYEGFWVNNYCDGKGEYTWTDGGKYEGDWVRGFRDGIGTMKFPDGRIYEGSWKSGNQNGGGVLTLSNGDKYEGVWAKNILRSVKKVYYYNGDTYEGGIGFENLKKHGKGVLTLKNGDKYDGLWEHDKQHGEGKEILKDGKLVFEGVWKEGTMVGEVTMTDANGTKFKAEWKKVEGE